MALTKTFKLNTGALMPAIGLGTFNSKPGELEAAIRTAIKCGYKHIDCAHLYNNEAEIGHVLSEVLKEGGVKREDIFITSKLWPSSHAREDVLDACKLTLKNLQLDYLDLYLTHSPTSLVKGMAWPSDDPADKKRILGYDKKRTSETWKGMEDLVRKGLCKAIGVSNFTILKVKNLLETAEIKPAANQVELHPYLPQPDLKKLCEDNGILLTAYTSLGRPSLQSDDNDPVLIEDTLVKDIAKKRNCTPAQVLLAWGVKYGCPVIPKSVNEGRIKQNLETYNVKLVDGDMEALANIGKRFRYLKMDRLYREEETAEMYWDGEQ